MKLIKCESQRVQLSFLSFCWGHGNEKQALDVLAVGNNVRALHLIRPRSSSNTCSILQKSGSSTLGSDECGQPYA